MRKSTCVEMTTKSMKMDELDCFIQKLGSSLSGELNKSKTHVDEEALLKSFQTTIASLPSCHIKKEIEHHLKEYFEKFKMHALQSNSRHRGLDFDLANEDSLLGALMTIEKSTSVPEKTSMYSRLLLCCVISSPSKLPVILEHWTKSVIATYSLEDTMEVLQAVCIVLPNMPDPPFILKFILRIVTHLIENYEALHKAGHQFLSSLLDKLFHTITVTAYRLQPVESGCYGNELVALLSIYMELSIRLQIKDVPLENTTRLVLVTLECTPRLILDVPLQMDSSSQSTTEFTTLLMVLYTHVVTNHSLLIQQDSAMYLKVYCSLVLLSDTTYYIKSKKQFDCLAIPVDFSIWVWSQSPEICKLLHFKSEWSSKQLKGFLIANVVTNKTELDHLLDLLNGMIVMSSTTLPQLPQNTSPKLVDVSSDVTQSTTTDCFYFVDNEGSQKVKLDFLCSTRVDIPPPPQSYEYTVNCFVLVSLNFISKIFS